MNDAGETSVRYAGAVMKRATFAIVATMFVALAAPRGSAQTAAPTLMAPQAPSKTSRPVAPAKPMRAGRMNPCGVYGEGFVNVPGSDTCVKVGGYVRSDAAVKLGR